MTATLVRQRWIQGVSLLVPQVALLFVFRQVPDGSFLNWDDDQNFLVNYAFRGFGWSQFKWAWTTDLLGVYQPVAWLALAGQYTLFGLNPRAFFLVSIGVHALVTMEVYWLILLLGGVKKWSAVIAGAAALLFAIHPQRVQSVAWLSCQPYLWCGLFYVFTIISYLKAKDRCGRQRMAWLAVALASFILALLCKAAALTCPVVMLLLEDYPVSRRPLSLRAKIPFFLLSFVFAGLALVARRELAHHVQADELSIGMRLVNLWLAVGEYAHNFIWPFSLTSFYPIPQSLKAIDPALLCWAAASLIALLGVWRFRRAWPGLAIGCAGFLVTISPNLGLVTFNAELASDRYTYLASIPLVTALAAHFCVIHASRGLGSRWLAPSFLIACLVIAGLGLVARRRVDVWHDSTAMWTDAIAGPAQASGIAFVSRAAAEYDAGRFAAAEQDAVEAVRLQPNLAASYNVLALIRLHQGHGSEEAAALFQQAIALDPDLVTSRLNYATILIERGDLDQAGVQLRQALDREPTNPVALSQLGLIALKRGSPAQAQDLEARALRIASDYAPGHVILGEALYQIGAKDQALAEFSAAIKTDPKIMEAYYNAGQILREQGDVKGALAFFDQALRVAPEKTAWLEDHIGSVLLDDHQIPAAIVHFERAAKAAAGDASISRHLEVAKKMFDLDSGAAIGSRAPPPTQ